MTFLSPSELVAAAPAAQKMPTIKHGLIDTHAFIRFIERELGHRPVLAVQGKAHNEEGASKRTRERQGRHFIVCANAAGRATILLNSHTVRRKAWIAGGYFRQPDLLLVGVAIPLQRWRGFGPAIEELERYRGMMADMRASMRVLQPSIEKLAKAVSETAYLPGHNPISPDELAKAGKATVWDTLFAMHGLILKGNLASAETGKRKVKPINGPDARMQAANALFNAGLGAVDRAVALPTYRKT